MIITQRIVKEEKYTLLKSRNAKGLFYTFYILKSDCHKRVFRRSKNTKVIWSEDCTSQRHHLLNVENKCKLIFKNLINEMENK